MVGNYKIKTKTIIFLLIVIFNIFAIYFIAAKDNAAKNDVKYRVTDIKEYIYSNLSLTEKEYKFVSIKGNGVGDVLYVFQLYKAKGTLLVYINIPSNTIGHRIISEIKVPHTVAFNQRKEILINTVAGGNKFYYISPKISLHSFESPSYNLSEPMISNSYFYWLGYKYTNDKKTDKKARFFRYKYDLVEDFEIAKLLENFKKEKLEIVQVKPLDDYIIFNLSNKANKKFEVFLYNLSNEELRKIYQGNNTVLDFSNNKELFFVDSDNKDFHIYKYDFLTKQSKKILSSKNGKYIANFKVLNSNLNRMFFVISFLYDTNSEEERFENLLIENSEIKFNQKYFNILDGYYDRTTNKKGIFYLFKESLAEVVY